MNPSLVVRLGDKRVHLLRTGDIEKKAESRLVLDHAPLAAEFLKVPHQGAGLSQPSRFLRLSRLESP
jgi:beta-lactamase superfamily II metal-dependent hydrolase